MEVFSVLFLIGVFILSIILALKNRGTATVTQGIPGPKRVDLKKGHLDDIAKAGGFIPYLNQQHKKFGPIIEVWTGDMKVVSTASPHLLKQMAKWFNRPAEALEAYLPVFRKENLAMKSDELSRKRHAAYGRCFSQGAIKKQISTFQQVTDATVKKWQSLPECRVKHLKEEMFDLAVKSILRSSFGKWFDDDNEVAALRKSYNFVWPFLEDHQAGIDLQEGSEQKRKFDEEIEKMHSIMNKALEDIKTSAGSCEVYDEMVKLHLTEEEILADAITLVVAGFHTTGMLLTWVLYYFAVYPEVQAKVVEEINEVLGATPVTEQNVGKLRYLECVFNESLRHSTLAPIISRYNDQDTTLDGYKIEANTPVFHLNGFILMDPNVWENPERFNPDRFSPKNIKSIPPFAFEPFGFAGKRKCPGYRFSLIEAKVVLVGLLRHFVISVDEGFVAEKSLGFVTNPKQDITLNITARH